MTRCVFSATTIRDHETISFLTATFLKKYGRTLLVASALLLSRYTIHWEDLIGFLIDSTQETKLLFLLRYILQITLYSLWREPDNIKHGIPQTPTASKMKMIDMQVRNQCLTINVTRYRKYDGLLQSWLATRLKLCFYQTKQCYVFK